MGTNGEEWTNTPSLRFLFSPELFIHSLTELSSLIDSITTTESVDHHHFHENRTIRSGDANKFPGIRDGQQHPGYLLHPLQAVG